MCALVSAVLHACVSFRCQGQGHVTTTINLCPWSTILPSDLAIGVTGEGHSYISQKLITNRFHRSRDS